MQDAGKNFRAQGSGKRDRIEHDPDCDSLRDGPRMQAMLQKLC
jgi:hypothetical protein